MQDGGRLVEVSGLSESYLSVEAIADRVRALWAHAHKSVPLIATELFIIVLARSDHRSNDRWLYLWNSLNDTIGEDRHIYLESRIGTGETAGVSLWIAEGKR